MKIITWNVNGIRAVERKKDLQAFLEKHDPDIFKIQEIKGNKEQFSSYLTENEEYDQYYSSAEKKGYSGTGIWIKKNIAKKLENLEYNTEIKELPNSDEGRISQINFTFNKQNWSMFSIYFPNGGKSELAWEQKLVFFERILAYMNELREKGINVLVGGDMNVAHNEIDIARPKENDGKIGFHPKERAWMDKVMENNWIDVWRSLNPDTKDVYSWWHMISRGRQRNVGWRIDYFFLDKESRNKVKKIDYLNDQMGSDHCPLMIEIEN